VPWRSPGTLCLEATHPSFKRDPWAQNKSSLFCPWRPSQPAGPAIVLLAHEDWRGGENSAREGRGGSSGGGLLSRCDGLLCPLVPPRQDPVRLARQPLRRRPPPQRRPSPLQRQRPPPLLRSRSPHLLRRRPHPLMRRRTHPLLRRRPPPLQVQLSVN
jgi:hypothetical protein